MMQYYVLSRYFNDGTLDIEISPCVKRDVYDLKKSGDPPYNMGNHVLYVDSFMSYEQAMSFSLDKFKGKPIAVSGSKVLLMRGKHVKKRR